MGSQRLRRAIALAITMFALVALISKLLPIPFGVFIVPTRSMVPTIEPGDMVIVYGKHVKIGDIVVWCTGPLYCVVHRLVGVRDGLIITKGDANPVPDNPVPVSRLKGRVVAIVPRYVWIPLLLSALLYVFAPSISSLLREEGVSPLVIAGGVFGFYVALAVILPFLYTSMSVAMLGYVKQPVLFLSKASFNEKDCTITIRYMGEHGLHLLSVENLVVDNMYLDSYVVGNDTVTIYLPPVVLTRHVENTTEPRIRVVVDALLTRLGRLHGVYEVFVPFKPLGVRVVNETLVVVNPNCYPLHVNITFLYAYSAGSSWRRVSDVVLVDKVFEAKPPVGARFVYAVVSYRAYGHIYTAKLRIR